MKKVILFAAVATTIALASCGKKAEEAPAVDSMAVDTAVVAVDTVAVVDTTVADTAAVAVAE